MAEKYELAYQIWPLLTTAAAKQHIVTYGELAKQLGFKGARVIRLALGPIQELCLEKGYPPLTILAVNKSTRKPGTGFVAWLGDLEAGQKRVFDFDWTIIPIPFAAESRKKPYRGETSPSGSAEDFSVGNQAVLVNGRGYYQGLFRSILLDVYDGKCALCETKLNSMLVASHIIPWSDDENNRLNPRNGILLCRNHDGLFEEGVIWIDTSYRVACMKVRENEVGKDLFNFITKRTRSILRLPRTGYEPDTNFLKWKLNKDLKVKT